MDLESMPWEVHQWSRTCPGGLVYFYSNEGWQGNDEDARMAGARLLRLGVHGDGGRRRLPWLCWRVDERRVQDVNSTRPLGPGRSGSLVPAEVQLRRTM